MITPTEADQLLLFAVEPRKLAGFLGLDWGAARKLHADKLLSFDPERTNITTAGMESEFIFLGSLVAAGCDVRMLKRMLSGLERPYRYDVRRMYFDWVARRWEHLRQCDEPEAFIFKNIKLLEEKGDVSALQNILERVQEAVDGLSEDEGQK